MRIKTSPANGEVQVMPRPGQIFDATMLGCPGMAAICIETRSDGLAGEYEIAYSVRPKTRPADLSISMGQGQYMVKALRKGPEVLTEAGVVLDIWGNFESRPLAEQCVANLAGRSNIVRAWIADVPDVHFG